MYNDKPKFHKRLLNKRADGVVLRSVNKRGVVPNYLKPSQSPNLDEPQSTASPDSDDPNQSTNQPTDGDVVQQSQSQSPSPQSSDPNVNNNTQQPSNQATPTSNSDASNDTSNSNSAAQTSNNTSDTNTTNTMNSTSSSSTDSSSTNSSTNSSSTDSSSVDTSQSSISASPDNSSNNGNSNNTSSNSHNGLSGGGIAGICVGIAALVAIIALIALAMIKRRKRAQKTAQRGSRMQFSNSNAGMGAGVGAGAGAGAGAAGAAPVMSQITRDMPSNADEGPQPIPQVPVDNTNDGQNTAERSSAFIPLPVGFTPGTNAVATNQFVPSLPDEVPLMPGDRIKILKEWDDGWCSIQHLQNGTEGVCPKEVLGVSSEADDFADSFNFNFNQRGSLYDNRRSSSLNQHPI